VSEVRAPVDKDRRLASPWRDVTRGAASFDEVVQERRDAFRVALVLHETPRGGLERLAGRLRDILGPGVSARVDVVAALEPGASRKFSPYVSYERLSAREMANAEGRH
jgi:hypothetical protein